MSDWQGWLVWMLTTLVFACRRLRCRVSRLGLATISILPEFFEIEASEPMSHGLTAKTVDAMNSCVTRHRRHMKAYTKILVTGLTPPPYLLAIETDDRTGEQIQWFRIVVPVRLRSNCGTVIVTCAQPTRSSQRTTKDCSRQAGRHARIVAKPGWIASCHEMGRAGRRQGQRCR